MRLLKFFVYICIFVLFLFIFLPKTQIYFYLEKQLQKEKIIIVENNINESIFHITLGELKLYRDDIYLANIEEINFTSFFIFNKLSVNNINIESSFAQFVPLQIDFVNFTYSILNPINILAFSKGSFGEAKLNFNLSTKTLNIVLNPSKNFKNKYKFILQKMKQIKGEYLYEYKL